MKLSFLGFLVLSTGVSASAETRSQRRLTKEFMQAMHSNPKLMKGNKTSRAAKVRKLHEQLMSASRKLQQNKGYSYYNQMAAKNYYNRQGDMNQAQGQWNGQGQGQGQWDGQWQGQYEEGQAYADAADWNGQYWEFENTLPFDMTARSFKYAGCAAIKTYDDNQAYEYGNPMALENYAVFRLCPANKCNKYSMTGCGKNYGEYAIDLKTYLAYVLSFYEERYEQFCDYCEPCDWEYQAYSKSALEQCYQSLTQQQYANANMQKQQAWQNYYNNNNGDMSGWNANGGSNGDQAFQAYNTYYNEQANYNDMDYNNPYGNRKLEDGQEAEDAGENADGDNNYEVDQETYNEYQNAVNNQQGYWGADGKFYMYAQDQQQEQYPEKQMYECLDGSTCDYCQMMHEQEYATCDNYVCGDYYTYCSDLYGQQSEYELLDFIECQPFQTENGQTFYVGPHCGSDHFTISLGVFSDESCTTAVDVSLSYVLGSDFSDEDLFKLPKECISCDGTSEEDEDAGAEENQGRYGEYATAPETDVDGVVAMCRALYEGSATCNSHMNDYDQMTQYMSSYERESEKINCAFIDNIIGGNYDESGEIRLTIDQFDFSDWRNIQQYKRLRMPKEQAFMLAISIIGCVGMAFVAMMLHRSLQRSTDPWVPKRTPILSPEDLARKSSGVRIARARSGRASDGVSDAPLI